MLAAVITHESAGPRVEAAIAVGAIIVPFRTPRLERAVEIDRLGVFADRARPGLAVWVGVDRLGLGRQADDERARCKPEDAGRREVLRQRARRRGWALEEPALEWLLRRVGRDLGGLTALLDRLDRASLAAQRRITVPFLRQVLGA